ncbi:hypothetical protein EV286_11953, partial [Rhizobium sp. BK251]
DVAPDGKAPMTLLLDRCLGLFGILTFIEMDDRDVGSFASKKDGDRAPDA